jgi:hypothetical protein
VLGGPHGATVRLGMKRCILQFRLRMLGLACTCTPLEGPTCGQAASPLASLPRHRGARRPPLLPLPCCLPSASCSPAGPAGAGTGIACPVGVEGKIASPAGCVFSIAYRRNKALGGGWKSPHRGHTRKHQERVQRGPCRSCMSLCAKGITGCTGHGPILAQAEASDGVIEGETNAQDYCT